MKSRLSACLAYAALLMSFAGASAAERFDAMDVQRNLELVRHAGEMEYQRQLASYDAYLEARPFDVAAAVQRCRFIAGYAAGNESDDWTETEVDEDAPDCGADLRQRFGNHPEVELYELERLYGDAAIKRAEELQRTVIPSLWTTDQSARLYTSQARLYQMKDAAKAKQAALRALKMDSAADVRLIAARQLLAEGDDSAARAMLTSPFDTHQPGDYWYASEKMKLLMQSGAVDDARRIYTALKDSGATYDRLAASKLLRQMAAIEAARAELAAIPVNEWNAAQVARESYLFEFESGTPAQALGAYNKLRDQGYRADPFGLNRVALLVRDATLPWRPRDLLGFFSAGAAIAVLALLALIPVSLVHYRGLVLRARSGEPPPDSNDWQLRHAWWMLAALTSVEIIALYFAGPLDLLQDTQSWALTLMPGQWARVMMAGEICALLLVSGFAYLAHRPSIPWSQRWSVGKSVMLGVGVGLALRIPLFLVVLAAQGKVEQRLLQDVTLQAVTFVRDGYGIAAAGWLLCVAAPVLEEFVFRGVVLRTFSRHVPFGWANVLQAGLFALAHLNLPATPVLFALGLLAGALMRRSGGLLAPILAHAAFNLVVAWLLLA